MTIAYRNTMTGETRTYDGWKAWAENFYTSLASDDLGRDCSVVKKLDILMPKDWWTRTQKVLKLEEIEL